MQSQEVAEDKRLSFVSPKAETLWRGKCEVRSLTSALKLQNVF